MARNTTHEADEAGRLACHLRAGDLTPVPGESTCGHQNCREIRERIRLKNRPSWLLAWPVPLTRAQAYAAGAYSDLRSSICPGGIGHEGNGASAEYCDACLAGAIAAAYVAGRNREREQEE
jgi:hypothetical protein